uniref:Uncharacterized protein n=1 Tax=Odontella aurita TaxID=265563 RepID=A0A7S4MMF6_9STRA|mmetsp:Transcript_26167/g.77438  ORF Transcript_26167/g.77438 Transcript_26167/m.77438 type:complete len:708 (+) Transcript_26167:165-2288(+)|eukprot:CAMPEP_0113528656 /NCGR_PEP_ID=MMETSP0015_2-20120614/1960_1 /TAXON_ID=2838 /ORGANISM="Odontella" /LENGTH=707 /DNA_ID=CAMNT_0000427201 /DNA_START=53 /DNA_END=2176 /DNA_ORIENTATION=- /assembly_acc=CAM_ASM_000160
MSLVSGGSDDRAPKHAWSQATNRPGLGCSTQIADVSTADGIAPSNQLGLSLVTPYEAESHLIPSLRHFAPSEIGSSDFIGRCCVDLERLAMTAHANAAERGGGNEYVVEGLAAHDKVGTLVKICISMECWRTMVLFPRGGALEDNEDEYVGLAPLVASNSNVLRASFSMHVETTAIGLLNLMLYRREGADELGREDGAPAVALVDYCARQMAALAVPVSQSLMLQRQKEPQSPTSSASELSQRLQSRTPLGELTDANFESEFKTCISTVATARYLCEHFDALPLGAQNRVLDVHDFVLLMVSLIEEPPWTRRRSVTSKSGETYVVWEKIVDDSWRRIPSSDLLIVTKLEAQPWLALYHLLCNDSCRERYGLDSFRKSQLLRVRKYLNETLLDQLPVLADVMRYLDQLALMAVPESTVAPGSREGNRGSSSGAPLLLEQVDSLREDLVPRGVDWDEIARDQFARIWSKITDATDSDLRRISEVYCGPSSASEDGGRGKILDRHRPEEPLSRPLREVQLRLYSLSKEFSAELGPHIASFRLLPADDSTKQSLAVPTQHGLFVRMKLRIVQQCQENGGNTGDLDVIAPFPVLPMVQPVATVSFCGRPSFDVDLSCNTLDLPNPFEGEMEGAEGDAPTEIPSSLPSREWRQLGLLDENKLVLQLGFKRLSRVSPVQVSSECGSKSMTANSTSCACYGLDRAFLSKPVDEHQ